MSTGAWGQPEVASSDAMAGPAQLTAVSRWARDVGIRPFPTQAALLAATGMLDGYRATVDTIPGAIFVYSASSPGWFMHGLPRFASLAAVAAAITSPATNWRVAIGAQTYIYSGGWVILFDPNRTIFTRASGGTIASSGSFGTVVDFPTALVNGGHFTNSSGTFTCAIAGTYRVILTINVAANATGARGIRLQDNAAAERTLQLSTFNSVSGTLVLTWTRAFTVGQTIRGEIQQNSGSTLAYTGEMDFEMVAA